MAVFGPGRSKTVLVGRGRKTVALSHLSAAMAEGAAAQACDGSRRVKLVTGVAAYYSSSAMGMGDLRCTLIHVSPPPIFDMPPGSTGLSTGIAARSGKYSSARPKLHPMQ